MKSPILRIAIIGPESTGKSTLASALAKHYRSKWAPEYARAYLEKLDRPYNQSDLIEIARGQIEKEEKAIINARDFVFFDTNLEVIKVWSKYIYDSIPDPILHWHKARHYDAYLLTDIDLPWTFDPLREHPEASDRQAIMEMYRQICEKSEVPYKIINGSEQERMNRAISFLDAIKTSQETKKTNTTHP